MECVERALTKSVLPDLKSELKRVLLAEAKEFVLKACCRKLYNWIKVNNRVVHWELFIFGEFPDVIVLGKNDLPPEFLQFFKCFLESFLLTFHRKFQGKVC